MELERSKGFGLGAEGSARRSQPVEVATRQPRLVVDLASNVVAIDGEREKLARKYVLVLWVLWNAKGQPMFAPQIKDSHPDLKKETHICRHIKEMQTKYPKGIGKLIEKMDNGYRIVAEYID